MVNTKWTSLSSQNLLNGLITIQWLRHACKALVEISRRMKSNTVGLITDRGYSEIVLSDKLSCQVGKMWHLPHHGIIHNKKAQSSTWFCKVRQGPNLMNKILGVLLQLRKGFIGVKGSTQQMLNQMNAMPADHDDLCFLWWPDIGIHIIQLMCTGWLCVVLVGCGHGDYLFLNRNFM